MTWSLAPSMPPTEEYKPHGPRVCPFGQNPGFHAPQGAPHFEQRTQDGLAEATPAMGWSDSHFVDPQLRSRFVGVDVVNSGCESDNHSGFESHRHMVPRIGEKHPGRLFVNGVIKHTRPHLGENGLVATAKNADFNRHARSCSSPGNTRISGEGAPPLPLRPRPLHCWAVPLLWQWESRVKGKRHGLAYAGLGEVRMLWVQDIVALTGDRNAGNSEHRAASSQDPCVSNGPSGCGRWTGVPVCRQTLRVQRRDEGVIEIDRHRCKRRENSARNVH